MTYKLMQRGKNGCLYYADNDGLDALNNTANIEVLTRLAVPTASAPAEILTLGDRVYCVTEDKMYYADSTGALYAEGGASDSSSSDEELPDNNGTQGK